MSDLGVDPPTLEEIDNLESYMDAMLLVMDLPDYPERGLDTLDDVQTYLRLRYHTDYVEPDTLEADVVSYLRDYSLARDCILVLYSKLNRFFTESHNQSQLSRIDPVKFGPHSANQIKMKQLRETLTEIDCPILVAGEAKAGKSSFINLFLGEYILPVDNITMTRIVCNIRYGERKMVTFRQSSRHKATLEACQVKEDPYTIDLSHMTDEIREELIQKVRDGSDNGDRYDEADFFWPFPLLQTSTYIMDSPGIRDEPELNTTTLDLVRTKSAAFIFILNASNAGGLNIWVEEFLQSAYERLLENSDIGDAKRQIKKALFVFNQWDKVIDEHKDEEVELKEQIIERLKSIWPGLDAEHQVFFLSSVKTFHWMRAKAAPPESLRNFYRALQNIMIETLKLNIETNVRFLEELLGGLEIGVRREIKLCQDLDRDRMAFERRIEHLLRVLLDIRTEAEEIADELIAETDKNFHDVTKWLCEHLHKDEVVNRLTDVSNVPTSCHHRIDIVTLMIQRLIKQKLEQEITQWNHDTDTINHLFILFESSFKNKLADLGASINAIDSGLVPDFLLFSNDPNFTDEFVKKCQMEVLGRFETAILISGSLVLFPVVALGSIFAAPLVAYSLLVENMDRRQQMRLYTADSKKYVETRITNYIYNLSPHNIKKTFFDRLYNHFITAIQGLPERVDKIIKSEEQKLETLTTNSLSWAQVLHMYSPIEKSIQELYGSLHLINFHYQPVNSDYEYDNVDTFSTDDEESLIARGTYATFYRSSTDSSVVFRVMNEVLTPETARQQYEELNYLKCLPFTGHIGLLYWKRFFRVYQPYPRLVHVMEACQCSLKSYLDQNPHLVPLQILSRPDVSKENSLKAFTVAYSLILDMAIQIASIISVLQEVAGGLVHRDLRTQNIMVKFASDLSETSLSSIASSTRSGIILKICDIGHRLVANDILLSAPRSRVCLPPEILQTLPDPSPMSSVFVFGAFLWELYTNLDPATVSPVNVVELQYNDAVVYPFIFGVPSPQSGPFQGCQSVPQRMLALIKACTSFTPQNRPSMEDCINTLVSIVNEVDDASNLQFIFDQLSSPINLED